MDRWAPPFFARRSAYIACIAQTNTPLSLPLNSILLTFFASQTLLHLNYLHMTGVTAINHHPLRKQPFHETQTRHF